MNPGHEGPDAAESLAISDESIVIDADAESPASASEYSPWTFFDSDRRILSDAELSPLSANTLWQARNEIFARRGYIFSSDRATDFVNSIPQSYYRGVTRDMGDISPQFNQFENRNIESIRVYEEQKKE